MTRERGSRVFRICAYGPKSKLDVDGIPVPRSVVEQVHSIAVRCPPLRERRHGSASGSFTYRLRLSSRSARPVARTLDRVRPPGAAGLAPVAARGGLEAPR